MQGGEGMADVGSANIRITADDKQARSKLSGFFGYLKKTSSLAAGIVGGLTLFQGLSDSLQAVADSTIGANANMEQYENTLTTVLKSHDKARKTLEWAQKFAAQTPFEIPGIVEATTRLESYGIHAQDVLSDIGDMAAVMGKPLMQAVEAIADAQTGELERLKEFGITKQQIINQSKKMGIEEIVNSQGQITNLKKFNEALFALMRERYQGGMELQSKTFKGLVSNASDAMGTLLRELSKPVFDKLKKGLSSIVPVMSALTTSITGDSKEARKELIAALGKDTADKIMKAFNNIKKGIKSFKKFLRDLEPTFDNLKKIVVSLTPIFKDVGGAIAVAWGVVAEILPPVLKYVTKIGVKITQWKGFIPIITGLVAAFLTYKTVITAITTAQKIMNTVTIISTSLQHALQAAQLATAVSGGGLRGAILAVNAAMRVLNITMLLNPFVWIPALIIGVSVALYELYKHSETFRKAVNKLWDNIKIAWNWIVDFTEKYLAPIVKNAWGEIKTEWNNAVKFFTKDLPNAFHTFVALFDSDTSDWKNIWKGLVKQTKDDGDDLKNLFSKDLPKAWKKFTDYVAEKSAPIGENIEEWKKTSKQKLAEWKTDFSNWFDSMRDVIPQKLAEWGLAIKNWLTKQNEENKRQYGEWWNSIQEWFTSLPDRTMALLQNWWNSIVLWISSTAQEWWDNLETWWSNISTWFSQLPSRVATKLQEWWSSIVQWFTSTAQSWWSNLETWWITISNWFSELPEKTKTKLNQWWSSISTWVISTAKSWRNSLESWWNEIKGWFAGLAEKPEVKNAGKNIVKRVAKGAEENKPELMDKLGKLVVDAIGYMLTATAIVILAAGRELIKRFINGIQSMKAKVGEKWEEFKQQAYEKIRSINLYNIGKDIVQGLINGLGSKLRSLKQKAKEIGQTVESAIRNKLKSKSPSRVTMDIGEDTGAGFVIGLDNMITKAVNKARELAEETTSTVQGSIDFKGLIPKFALGLEGLSSAISRTENHTHYWQINADEISDISRLIDVINGIVQTVRSR